MNNNSNNSNSLYYIFDRNEITPFINFEIKKSLDVGCASGIFSDNIKQKTGAETWGIEMVEDVAMVAKQKLDNVLIGTFEEVYGSLPENYFDCVFFNDVLEHMSYPEDCLLKIKDNLKKDGHIIASIPNMRHINVLRELLFDQEWEYKELGILDKTHLRFFTKKSIIKMFDRCGYEIKVIEGINETKSRLISLLRSLPSQLFKDIAPIQFVVVATPK